jgi:dimethylhistidine N-methyltransferase
VVNGNGFAHDVLTGLQQPRKELHCKYFYDERGSRLFDQICELREYYLTRTESAIMMGNSAAIAKRIGRQAVLIEYGSGSSTKTRLLLDHLEAPQAYLPVDISEEHLLKTAKLLEVDYPELDIHPIVADFTSGFELPPAYRASNVTVFFPGSTIGNLEVEAAVALLRRIAVQCGPQGGLLIGFDLLKDERILLDAYDDPHGVTAEFNLNLLHRINRELGANFNVDNFAHLAVFNRPMERIEIFIESRLEQTVSICGQQIGFARGERIFTEFSHKYHIDGFRQMAHKAGLSMDDVWVDVDSYFAVMHLSVA